MKSIGEMFVRVGLVVLLASPVSLHAECLGCPAGALEVEVFLDDGGAAHGFVVIHNSQVRPVIDHQKLPLDRARLIWQSGNLEIWDRVITLRQPVIGTDFKRWQSPDGSIMLDELGRHVARLGPDSIILIGKPREIPLEKILKIEDRSIHEGHYKLQGPVFHVSEVNRRFLVERPLVTVVIHDRIEYLDQEYYCFSYLEDLPPKALAERCVESLGKTEEGIIKLFFPGTT